MDIQMPWLLRPTWQGLFLQSYCISSIHGGQMWGGRAMQEQLPRCKRAAHSPKNLSMALSAEVAEIVEHLTNHGCSNVVGAGSTGTTQWLTEEQS